MIVKISVFFTCAEANIYFLLLNLHDCTFKRKNNKILTGPRYLMNSIFTNGNVKD